MKKLIFVLFVLLPVFIFAVDYYYVDTTGSDALGDGSEGNPWATIQHAIDNASDPGGVDIVIYISAGTFNLWTGVTTETIVINRDFQDLTLQGSGAEETIIQGHSVSGSADNRIFYINNGWGDVEISDVTIRYGNTINGGGGVYCYEVGYLVLNNCNIEYNHADERGGGILNGNRCGLGLYDSTVHHNTTDGNGGGISNYENVHISYSPHLDIRNSTICHNSALNQGGGISARSVAVTGFIGSRLHFSNTTVSQNNSGNQGGGVYYGPDSSGRLKNSIFADNNSDSNQGEDFYFYPPDEDMEDYGYNIIEFYEGYDFSSEASNYTGSQPLLNLSAALAANFTTEGTYTLKTTSGSIAIDNGDDTPMPAWGIGYLYDQRNAPRNGNVDIGAYEWWADSGDYPREPSDHVSGFSASAIPNVTIDLEWIENGRSVSSDGYLILASTGAIVPPEDDTSPADDLDLTDGEGNVMVADGTDSYTFSNCSSETTYNFAIYPYTNSFGYYNYKTDYDASIYVDATTGKPEPMNHVTSFVAEPDVINGIEEIDNLWTDSVGGTLPDTYLIKVNNSGFAGIAAPTDGTPEVDNTDLSGGAGAVNVAHAAGGSYSWTSLDEGTTYYFKIYPYTNTGDLVNYKIDGIVPSSSTQTFTTSSSGDLIITEIVGDGVDMMGMSNTGFIEFRNVSGSILDLSDVTVEYYNDGSPIPTSTLALFGSIGIDAYKIICQEHSAFMMTYGFDADFQAPFNWGMMTSEFPLDGGGDSVLLVTPDLRATVDRFNDPSDPFTWTDDEPLERTSSGDGGDESAWTENTGGEGSPGQENDNPLPVTLSSFFAEFSEGVSMLQWTTQSESNNQGWNVFRADTANIENGLLVNDSMIPGAGTTTEQTNYSFQDEFEHIPLQTYFYWLESIDLGGTTHLYGPVSVDIPDSGEEDFPPELTVSYGLYQNLPNPFNPSTRIAFKLKEDTKGVLEIYNVKGQLVKTLFDGHISADEVSVFVWNGEDKNGSDVSSGMFFYKLTTTTEIFTKKMLMMK